MRRLLPSAARELEPALAPTLRLALEAPDDHAVDPRRVLEALRHACLATGVTIREQAPLARLALDGERVTGVELSDGERLEAETVVLATGPWSGALEGLPPGAGVPVRPVKGQIMRLRDPAGAGLVERVIRFEGGYVVPRGDGRYVLGATVEERGFELGATAGGVYELLRDARELLPGTPSSRSRSWRRAAAGHARQPAGDRARPRGRGPPVGDRPPPQRHPARAADGRAGRRRAAGGAARGRAALALRARALRSRHDRAGRARGGPGAMIVLNGRSCELPSSQTLLDALAELGVAADARGVAVAVDGEVVPRADWHSLQLADGARVEVLTAMQGG